MLLIFFYFYCQPPFYSRDVSQMYDNILHKPLHIQGTKTIAACDILQGLLHKDQKKRLGAKTDFVCDDCLFLEPLASCPAKNLIQLDSILNP